MCWWRNKRREGRKQERRGEGGEGKVKGRKEEREAERREGGRRKRERGGRWSLLCW
jgi:hypothetical protein